jgi:alkylated DNA repair dioxygenase AlkB
VALTWQPTLLDACETGFDPELTRASRRVLGDGAWVDHVPGWATGADELFDRVLAAASWRESERPMYDRIVAVPRLYSGPWPTAPSPFPEMAEALGLRYEVRLPAISANLYRDGADSVAWHGDRVSRERMHSVVAILSLGEARRFLLRPVGGGRSVAYTPAPGDLLVLGGTCQRTWQHCVPKRAHAGPRISVMFRQEYDPIP